MPFIQKPIKGKVFLLQRNFACTNFGNYVSFLPPQLCVFQQVGSTSLRGREYTMSLSYSPGYVTPLFTHPPAFHGTIFDPNSSFLGELLGKMIFCKVVGESKNMGVPGSNHLYPPSLGPFWAKIINFHFPQSRKMEFGLKIEVGITPGR